MKDIVLSFKVDEIMRDEIKALANKKDIPVSQLIREAIKLYVQEANDKNE